MQGKVYFIGAGPGDPELLTLKAVRILKKADLVIYAGSLVPKELILPHVREDCDIISSADLTLEEIHAKMKDAVKKGKIVARVHTGDPSIYGAIHEQIYLLNKDNVDYEIVPGITSAFATAARAKVSFTLPEATQTLIITRLSGRTKVPEKESFEKLASHNSSLAIYLSSSMVDELSKRCIEAGYKEDTLVVIGYRVGWNDEKIIFSTLRDLPFHVKEYSIKRQAIFLILPNREQIFFSKLYDPEFSHGFRK